MNQLSYLLQLILLGLLLLTSGMGCSAKGPPQEHRSDVELHQVQQSSGKSEKMIAEEISVGDNVDGLKSLLSAKNISFTSTEVEDGERINIWALDEKNFMYTMYIHVVVHAKNETVTHVERESIGVGP